MIESREKTGLGTKVQKTGLVVWVCSQNTFYLFFKKHRIVTLSNVTCAAWKFNLKTTG